MSGAVSPHEEILREPPPPRVRQAVLLVGGRGTRLGVLTATTPKPLMDIGGGRVFLDLLIDNVARQGFDKILLLAGYRGEQIAERYRGLSVRGATIDVVVEPRPLGTGGALRWSRGKLDAEFLVVNGDTYFDIAYRALEPALHSSADIAAVVALRNVDDAVRYGRAETNGPLITRFREKVAAAGPSPGQINGGVYLIRRGALNAIPDGEFSLETGVFPALAASGRLAGVARQGYFIDIGLPRTLLQAKLELPSVINRPALFLDRDGVLNVDHGYVHLWSQFDKIPGAAETIRAFNEAGWFVFVITNQAGVAHGYYGEDAVLTLHDQIQDWLASEGAHVDAFYYCPYHPKGKLEKFRMEHLDRKPNPGMLRRAVAEFPVDSSRSWLLGDRDTDVAAAQAAGVRGYLFDGADLVSFVIAQGLWPEKRSPLSKSGV